MNRSDLPFKVDQVAESRSFISGYRGAWFRCKIKNIARKNGQITYAMEYFDFPDEKIKFTKVYQKPPSNSGKSKDRKKQLMVRPQFPPIYRESQLPDVNTISEMVVVVDDAWKMGDLVDWLCAGCYWSGRVTEILGDEKVKIELPPRPMGEGSSYEVLCKELRPSLVWSPECGWEVPIPVDNGSGRCCARIIKPVNEVSGGPSNLVVHTDDEGGKGLQAAAGASLQHTASFSSDISASSLQPPDGSGKMAKRPLSTTSSKEIHTPETNLELDMRDHGSGKTSCSDSVSSSHVRDASADIVVVGKDRYNNNGSSKKIKTDGSISLNSMCSDTLEAPVLDLEELVNRVKWIRSFLDFGKPLSNTMQAPWKFLEHRPSSTPK